MLKKRKKNKAPNEREILKKFYRLNGIAKKLGIPRETVYSAVKVGNLVPLVLGDGTRVVAEEQAVKWNETRPGRGGRPASIG